MQDTAHCDQSHVGNEENFIGRNDDDASLVSLVLKHAEMIMLLLLWWVSRV